MMRRAVDGKQSSRQQISYTVSVSAPVGGWNAIDPLSSMPAGDAVDLENWFPLARLCEIRGGSLSYATGTTGNGKTLAVYNGLSGTSKMFCATASGVYDVSSAGAVGASVAARTNGKHQWLMFGDGTSNWLIMVNGVDKPLYYDGTTWTAVDGASTPALTGLTTTNIIGLCIHKGRLMFIEKNTLSFWYLAAGSAGGALTEFILDGVAQKGGYLMAMASWTVDSGSGPDDRMVFVTSKGEVIVYQGTNPSSSTTWALVGVYTVGSPLGRRCIAKVGSDLIILTQSGVLSLATLLASSNVDYSSAVSRKIESAFNEAALTYGSVFGWEATLFQTRTALIINVPIAEDGTHHQYVMNTTTKAWCKFTGWDAETFAVFNDELYYAQGTSVIKAWTGESDQGANVVAYGKPAFSYFGNKSQLKKFKLFRPVLSINGSLSFLVDIDVDYQDNNISGVASYSVPTRALWGTAKWGIDVWGGGMTITKEWTSPAQWQGYSATGKIKVATNSLVVQWLSNDYVYEHGGVL